MQEIGQYFHAPTVLLSIIYKVILFQKLYFFHNNNTAQNIYQIPLDNTKLL